LPRVRTLTQRELNRALLARQLLLERKKLPLPKALERIGGIQAQYAPSMYIGLWSRLEGFERDSLTRALERKTVVQGTLMRSTIHLVSRRDYWPFTVAIREHRRGWWARVAREGSKPADLKKAVPKLRKLLAKEGVLTAADLKKLGRPVGLNLYLDMVRVPPSGTWERRRADLYAASEDWLGPPDAEPEQGVVRLVEAYLQGFGPASRDEIADWTGLKKTVIAPALDSLKLRTFEAEDGTELVDLPRLPLPDADTPAPARFLPTWDSTLLAHTRRTQILPEEFRPFVFNTKTPQSMPSFMLDGQVAGSWRWEKGRIELNPFRKLTKAEQRELNDEAERLAEFHA
jgi:Winged helix DNA-binding domain